MEWLDWKVILTTVLVQLIGYGTFYLVSGTQLEQQPMAVYEQYQSDDGYDIFLVYFDDREKLGDVKELIAEFEERYPDYEILQTHVALKIRLDKVYEVLVIYARKVGDE